MPVIHEFVVAAVTPVLAKEMVCAVLPSNEPAVMPVPNVNELIVAAEMVPGSIRSTAQYILQNAGDILRADVYWRGGITALMKTAHLCEANGIKTELHHGASPLMDIATLHCACAIKNCEFLELLVPEPRYEFGLKDYSALHIDAEGNVHAPPGPGLGVTIDWDFIDRHTTFSG